MNIQIYIYICGYIDKWIYGYILIYGYMDVWIYGYISDTVVSFIQGVSSIIGVSNMDT